MFRNLIRLRARLASPEFLLWAGFVAAVVIASLQNFLRGPHAINNFLIFRGSFGHLTAGLDLYAAYPSEHHDLFKYSPTFALAMAPFATLPSWLGVVCWNLLNSLVLYVALRRVTRGAQRENAVLWLVFLEMMTAIHNEQSNALMAGLMLLAFDSLEGERPARAAWWVALAGFIKIYGFVFAVPAVLYRSRFSFAFALAAWSLLLAVAPLRRSSRPRPRP